ncbi:MAG TPA: radical SAM protein, partial [Nitrospiria bacterium]|nr:radical SAM protein [Nitrospiria bacterium]
LPPARHLLPPLSRYARLDDGERLRLVGAVEASRGCAHHCRHCPITPVYEGRVRIVQEETVLRDIEALAGLGAEHITFCDPDFLNGVDHSLRIVERMHERLPALTFDFTAKIQHVLEYRGSLPALKEAGCVFIQSAVESLNDRILGILKKEHTRVDVLEALALTRGSGIALRPSLVSFTPWTSADDYLDVLNFVEREGLEEEVDPIQFAIRLLVPPGSALLEISEWNGMLGPLDEENLCYPWKHPDERMDTLEKAVLTIVDVGTEDSKPPSEIISAIRSKACEILEIRPPVVSGRRRREKRRRSPRLTESWFCCAEPGDRQQKTIGENTRIEKSSCCSSE